MPDWILNSLGVLIEFGTPVAIALLTYAFVTKRGKDQADRQQARAVYNDLLKEFKDIKDSLTKQPKILSDYPIEREWHKETYVTPLRGIIRTGDYVFIPKKQLAKLEKLEQDSFNYGEKALKLVMGIPSVLDQSPALFDVPGEYLKKNPMHGTQCDNWYVMGDIMSMGHFRYASIFSFWDSEALTRELQEGAKIEFSDERRPANVKVILVPEQLASPPYQFAEAICEDLISNKEWQSLKTERDDLKQRLDDTVELLQKQARDPFPVWKTLVMAVRDLFRVN